MKTLIAMAMLAFGVAASAEVLDLEQTAGAGRLHQYHLVQTNDPATTVTIYISQVSTYSPTIELWFNDFVAGNQFFGTYSAGNQMVLTNPTTGQQIVVQLTETTVHVCTRSGRGQNCGTLWTLQDGSVTR